jgi:putative ABC transport system permease protein
MNWIAWRMLTGDPAKYVSLVFSIAFATLLMTQQLSIFMGIVKRSASQIIDVRDASIWVMDPKVRHIDEAPGLPPGDLQRVRSVPGVLWGVKFHKSQAQARTEDGNFRSVALVGVDDASLVATPREMIAGDFSDIKLHNAVIVDKAGYEYIWPKKPDEPYQLPRVLQINDRRVVLVGVCKASPPFVTLPVLYMRYRTVEECMPGQRSLLSFILAEPQPGMNAEEVCQNIQKQTGLMAVTSDQFFWKTIFYFLSSTGIPVNFGITISLGFIIGAVIAGQTFYLFTLENLKQFGTLKAMGVTNWRLIGMVLLQACSVGMMGYGLGMGMTAIFFTYTNRITHLAGIHVPWIVAAIVGTAVIVIVLLTSVMSLRRVLVLEPAVVFRG